jgi:hypothetical protein
MGWKKNHGIICASTLRLAAIVLNDSGVENSYLTGFLGWLWGDATWPYPNYSVLTPPIIIRINQHF